VELYPTSRRRACRRAALRNRHHRPHRQHPPHRHLHRRNEYVIEEDMNSKQQDLK
jgi:hypothetical protein